MVESLVLHVYFSWNPLTCRVVSTRQRYRCVAVFLVSVLIARSTSFRVLQKVTQDTLRISGETVSSLCSLRQLEVPVLNDHRAWFRKQVPSIVLHARWRLRLLEQRVLGMKPGSDAT